MASGGSLSCRAADIGGGDNAMTLGFIRCCEDPYDAEKRPQGIINMGVAENYVMHDVLSDWMNTNSVKWDSSSMVYNNYLGVTEFRQALATYLTKQGHAPEPLNPEQVIVMNGGDTCMEVLGFCLAEPNDAILCPTPYYGAIKANFGMRAKVNVFPFHLSSQVMPGDTKPFQLTVDKLETALKDAKSKDVNIKAVIVVNPHNPTGEMLSKQEVMDVLMFCKRHALHVIMDEVYMMTVFNQEAKHFSILSMKPSEIPDLERTHFIYSFSKDFSLSGLRIGVIYTWNKELIETCKYLLCFQQTAAYVQRLMAKMILDEDFITKTYFPTFQQRLFESHKCVTDSLKKLNVPYLHRSAGLFIWANFRKYLSSNTFEAENELLQCFFDNKVYFTPSVAFYGNEPGWFRIIFSRNVRDVKRGMERLAQVLNGIESNQAGQTASKLADLTDLAVSANEKGDETNKSKDASLEGLLSQLQLQIQDSNWLEQNTADQWKATNPDTYEAYKKEIEKVKK